jgi:hypothetical protein
MGCQFRDELDIELIIHRPGLESMALSPGQV